MVLCTTHTPLKELKANDMAVGQMGRDSKGNIYLRDNYALVCLNNLGSGYCSMTNGRPGPDGLMVELLPQGFIVTLTQE